jgi:hypothetical protein
MIGCEIATLWYYAGFLSFVVPHFSLESVSLGELSTLPLFFFCRRLLQALIDPVARVTWKMCNGRSIGNWNPTPGNVAVLHDLNMKSCTKYSEAQQKKNNYRNERNYYRVSLLSFCLGDQRLNISQRLFLRPAIFYTHMERRLIGFSTPPTGYTMRQYLILCWCNICNRLRISRTVLENLPGQGSNPGRLISTQPFYRLRHSLRKHPYHI